MDIGFYICWSSSLGFTHGGAADEKSCAAKNKVSLGWGGADYVGGFFGEHDSGGVGVAGGDAGHDGGVYDAEGVEAVDAEARVHDSHEVAAHLAGADRVIEGLGLAAN